MCPALLSALLCAAGEGRSCGTNFEFTGNTRSWRLRSWTPGARGVVVTGHSCGTRSPWSPSDCSSPRQGSHGSSGQAASPAGGWARQLQQAPALPQPFPIQVPVGPTCPCLQLLLCPSAEHAPASAASVSPSCWAALGEIKASVKKPRKNLYQNFLSTANL